MEDKASQLRLITKAVARLLERGTTAALVTVVDGSPNTGAKLLIDEAGSALGSLGDALLDTAAMKQAGVFLASREDTQTFRARDFAAGIEPTSEVLLLFERIRPEPRLVICGAGHVGAALATLSSFVGYHVTLIDDRAEFLRRDRFPDEHIELRLAEDWTTVVRQALGDGKGVAVAVVTRGHNEDEECMRAVVTANPDYVGMIGSKRRTSIVIDRLREAGAPEDKVRKIRAPIGLDIGAVSPEEVALAILAEIVAERRGGKGGSLSAWRRT